MFFLGEGACRAEGVAEGYVIDAEPIFNPSQEKNFKFLIPIRNVYVFDVRRSPRYW